MKVKVSKEAAAELIEAAAWYEFEVPGLGDQLIEAFEQALTRLSEPHAPLVPVTGQAARLGAKRLILKRFPFSVITVANSDVITVVALAHHSRKPGYWRERTSS
ncbi:MAG: type II toxin-antitoxin system RelE/ParE family toxin [Marinobacter sp.]|nr:type II toxin-antitoxin system RelE/ParE family toxin [Marinobacter sp.]